MEIEPQVITQTRTLGEKAAIRSFNPKDPSDIQRLLEMYTDPHNKSLLVGPPDTIEKIKKQLRHPGRLARLYAVSGTDALTNSEEIGHVQARLYFFPLEKDTIKHMAGSKLIAINQPGLKIEIGYVALPNAEHGQVASGVRQAIEIYLGEMHKPVNFYACTDSKNVESERVLIASGFTKIGTAAYSPEYQDMYNYWKLDFDQLDQIRLRKLTTTRKIQTNSV